MGGRSWMGVAGFRRVGRIVLGALAPVDVVVGGVGVWSRWGLPGEQELAGGVVGRECFNGSCWRSCIFRRRVIPGRFTPGRSLARLFLGRLFLDRLFLGRLFLDRLFLDRLRGGCLRRFFLDRLFLGRLGGGCLRRLSGHCDGGGGPWSAPGFAFVFASVVASAHADLVLGVVFEVRDGHCRGGGGWVFVTFVDLP